MNETAKKALERTREAHQRTWRSAKSRVAELERDLTEARGAVRFNEDAMAELTQAIGDDWRAAERVTMADKVTALLDVSDYSRATDPLLACEHSFSWTERPNGSLVMHNCSKCGVSWGPGFSGVASQES